MWSTNDGNSITNAIDFIGVKGDPVFLPDGTLVTTTDATSELWSGHLLHAIDEDINGNVVTGQHLFTWTGTNPDGRVTDPYNDPLVSGANAIVGDLTATDNKWITSKTDNNLTDTYHLYAISDELTAHFTAATVPEPTTAMLVGIGAIAIAIRSCRYRRNRGGATRSL